MKNCNQYTVCFIDLNPTKGAEINKIRPCVILTPDVMNTVLKTVTIAPITNTQKELIWPFMVPVKVKNNRFNGFINLSQIRTVDKTRLCLDKVDELVSISILEVKERIKEIFYD